MRKTLLFLMTLFIGCGGSDADLVLPNNVSIHYGGNPRIDADVRIAFEEITKYGENICGKAQFARMFRLNVYFVSGKLDCGEQSAGGCYPMIWVPIVHVRYKGDVVASALVHESMHHIWSVCTGGSGADGDNVHDAQFLADASEINERIRVRIR